MPIDKIQTLDDIKDDPYVIEHIIWDLKPKDLMEPMASVTQEGIKTRKTIKGYAFYIETMDNKPALFLIMHTASNYAETVAQVEHIPQELLLEALEEGKQSAYFGMYPINKKIQDWLKRELGVL